MVLHVWMDCGCIVEVAGAADQMPRTCCQGHPQALPLGALEDLAEFDSPDNPHRDPVGNLPPEPEFGAVEGGRALAQQGPGDVDDIRDFTRKWLASRDVPRPVLVNTARFAVLVPEDGEGPGENRQR